MSRITDAEDEIKAIAWNDLVRSKNRELELQLEIDKLRAEESECIWKYDQECSIWDTACSQAFVIDAGSPAENGMHFCCFCGHKLTI